MIPEITKGSYDLHADFIQRTLDTALLVSSFTGEIPLRDFRAAGVYLIINSVDFSAYVGQAQDMRKRFFEHKNDLGRNEHRNPHLQNAWNKYGASSFLFVVLEGYDVGDLDAEEQSLLSVLFGPYCYNICPLASTRRGSKLSEYYRKQISDRMNRPEVRSAASKRMSDKWADPEFRTYMSERMSSPEVKEIKRKTVIDPARIARQSETYRVKREQRLALLPPAERAKKQEELKRSREKYHRRAAAKKLSKTTSPSPSF